jgi:hypothetical protein
MPYGFNELTRQGLVVGNSLQQDDDFEIAIHVGEPLTEDELAVARWLEPQTAFLRLPSGRLCVESNDASRIGPEQPTEQGARLDVPPRRLPPDAIPHRSRGVVARRGDLGGTASGARPHARRHSGRRRGGSAAAPGASRHKLGAQVHHHQASRRSARLVRQLLGLVRRESGSGGGLAARARARPRTRRHWANRNGGRYRRRWIRRGAWPRLGDSSKWPSARNREHAPSDNRRSVAV